MQTLSRDEAVRRIYTSGGQIFGVSFIKRSTGELRIMSARLGVHSYLKGGRRSYDPKEHGLICVFDLNAKGYRSIPVEGLLSLSLNGEEYAVKDPVPTSLFPETDGPYSMGQ